MPVKKRWCISKSFIRFDSKEYARLNTRLLYTSKDKAVSTCAVNVFDEIGWENEDLVGRFSEVCRFLESGKTYSFADVVWQIQEV